MNKYFIVLENEDLDDAIIYSHKFNSLEEAKREVESMQKENDNPRYQIYEIKQVYSSE